jgi:TolA-binding protein
MANSMPEFDPGEQELHRLMGAPGKTCPSVALLLACGQQVLPPEVEREVQGHIEKCRLCSQLLLDLGSLPQEELSPLQTQCIAAKLPMQERKAASQWRLYAGAIAAAAIVAAGVAGLRMQHQTQTAATPVLVTAPPRETAALEPQMTPLAAPGMGEMALLTRGKQDSAEPPIELLMPAFTAYNRADYALAAQRFTKLQESYPQSEIIPLYLGVSELWLHRDAEARASLSKALRLAPKATADAPMWYAAIAAQRTGAPEARSFYAALCANTSSRYSADSCRIASTLR